MSDQQQPRYLNETQLHEIIEAKISQGIQAAMDHHASVTAATSSSPIKCEPVEAQVLNRILPRARMTSTPNILNYSFLQATALAKENNVYYIARMLEQFKSVQSIIDVKAVQHALTRKYDSTKLEIRKDLENGWQAIRSGQIEIDEFIIFTNNMSDSAPTKYASHLN